MNAELKPGMMAMVIGSVHGYSKHIGKIVTLKDSGVDILGEYWTFIEEIDDTAWKVLSKHLMPIKPEADPLYTKEEQHANA